MKRSDLLETNTALRHAVSEISELTDGVNFVGQARMDMDALEAESVHLMHLLQDIGVLVTDALAEDDDDTVDDDDDPDQGD